MKINVSDKFTAWSNAGDVYVNIHADCFDTEDVAKVEALWAEIVKLSKKFEADNPLPEADDAE